MMKVMKERVDILLVEQGLFDTREKAKRAIMAGIVYLNEVRVDKPGEKIEVTGVLTVKGKQCPYVGRGGYKLEKALQVFDIHVQDRILVDIGSSTGGFTDCALQNGVKMSYAVDVGHNQLAWKLRSDERVVVMEKTNFRYATKDLFSKGAPDLATIDVSFISLRLILPVVAQVMEPNSDIIALIKPQFEAGKDQVGKKGIVRDEKIHRMVVEDIIQFSINLGFKPMGLTYSPITGGDGNIEFLLHLKWNTDEEYSNTSLPIDQVVMGAKSVLNEKTNVALK